MGNGAICICTPIPEYERLRIGIKESGRVNGGSMSKTDVLFSNCVLVDNQLFVIDTQSGLPAIMNPISGKLTYCEVFQNFIWKDGDVIDFMKEYEGDIYALEMTGDNLVIFDLQKQQCIYISLNCNYHEWGNFVAFERIGSDFYIFPKYGNKIYTFSAKDRKIVVIEGPLGEKEEIQCACRDKNQERLLSQDGSKLYIYNLLENKWKIYNFNRGIRDCINCISRGESIYFINILGILYKWNIDEEGIQEITTLERLFSETETVSRIVSAGNSLIILPSVGRDIKIMNLLTSEMEIYHDYPVDFVYYDIEWSKYYGNCEDEEYYYFAMRRGNYFLKIRKADGKFFWIKPRIPDEKKRNDFLIQYQMKSYSYNKEKILYEDTGYLASWLKYMLVDNSISNNCTGIGKKIYGEWG